MAPISKSLALAGALFAAVGTALPVDKRENVVVWETVTDVEWTTVDVTTTIYAQDNTPRTTTIPVASVKPTVSAAPDNEPSEAPSTEPAATPTVAPTPTAVPPPAQEPNNPPPAPTTTVAPPPPPQPTTVAPPPEPEPTTTSAPNPPNNPSPPSDPSPPPSSPNPPSSGHQGACSKGSPCTGEITFYDTATSESAPSSCGTTNDGHSENVLALPQGIMQDGDCGKTVTVKYGGTTTTGTVVDKCMGCDNSSIDLSRHFFKDLASLSEGRISGVEWWIN